MKILLVSEYFPPKEFGGGEISAELLAKSLHDSGHEVTVLTSRFPGLVATEKKGYTILRRTYTGEDPKSVWGNIRRLNYTLSLRSELHKLKGFDVIHCLNNTSVVGCENYPAKRLATVNSYVNLCPKANLFYKEREPCTGCAPMKFMDCIMHSEYVGKLRMPWYIKHNPGFLLQLYVNYRRRFESLRKYKLLCVSDFVLEFVRKSGMSGEKVYNIFVEPKGKRDSGIKVSGQVFTYIGTLDRIKGIDLLIEGFAKAGEDGKTLLLVGDGPERKMLEEQVRRLKLRNVRFTGRVGYDQMPDIYRKSDCICLTAKWPEPLSRSLVEALYYGKPIIATDVGGNSECIDDGKNGWLVSIDADSVARSIRDIRPAMGKVSKKKFESFRDSVKKIEWMYLKTDQNHQG